MPTVVLREETLSFTGTMHGETYGSITRSYVPDADFPSVIGYTGGTATVSALGMIDWDSLFTSSPTRLVGFRVTLVAPNGTTTTADGGDTFPSFGGTGVPLNYNKIADGTWSITCNAELCLEITLPTVPSGTGSSATGFNPDPPHGYAYRVYWRLKSGATWSGSISLGGASASYSYSLPAAIEVAWPDTLVQSLYANADSIGATQTTTSQMVATYRTALLTVSASASGTYGSADSAGKTLDCIATVLDGGPYSSEASMSVAVPLVYDLDAQLRAMEGAYPDSMVLRMTSGSSTADTAAVTSSYSKSDTFRAEECAASTQGDTDSDSVPSNFGSISLAVKASSLTTNQEPSTDTLFRMADREMAGLSLSQPASTNLPAGTDTALGGSPYGVSRSWAAVGVGWVGLMGWRYLSIPVTTSAGTGSQSGTVVIGSKSWAKDYLGATLTTPALAGSATWVIDLCSPTSSTTSDATDTTYPYSNDWDVDGGTEDSWWRTGEGVYTGPLRAVTLAVQVGASATLTLGTLSLTRTDTNDVAVTVLPPHRAWVNERPERVVSEADTTTEYFVRQSVVNATEGRLLALEWTDTLWKRTTGGASGVVTHTLTEYGMDWLDDRIDAGALAPGWTATENAPAVAGSGLAVWYNREREVHGLLGGGYYHRSYASAGGAGWLSGIDVLAEAKVAGTLTSYNLPWQGGFTSLTACPGDTGDVFLHLSADTTGALKLKAYKIFRCQGEGLSLDTSGVASSGDTVELTQTTSRGTGTTDTYGYGQTGTDYGFGAGATAILAVGSESASYTPRARKRLHLRAKPGESAGGLSIDTAPNGRTVIAYESAGSVLLGFMVDMAGASFDAVDPSITGTQPAVRYVDTDDYYRVVILYTDSGAVKLVYTDDEGGSISVPATLFATGEHGAVDASPAGWLLVAAYNAGAITCKWVDRAGNVLAGPFTIVASGADDDSIGVSYDAAAERWYCVYTASGVVTVKYSDDAETWT